MALVWNWGFWRASERAAITCERRLPFEDCSDILAAGHVALCQQASFIELAKLFENEPNQAANEMIAPIQRRPGVRMFAYSFSSHVAGRVPGVLVTPDRRGSFPVILFGHWMMPGSPMRNRNEFLEEAIVFARAGAICLLLDSPLVRDGVTRRSTSYAWAGPNGCAADGARMAQGPRSTACATRRGS